MRIEDTTAVVGGGSQGIGAGIARALARHGARRVTLLARRPGPLEETARAIGPAAATHSVDLADAGRVREVAAQIVERDGVPDVVVASSAQGRLVGLVESEPGEAVDAMASTYFAAYFLFRAFIDGMLARGSGRLVVVGSPIRSSPFRAVAYKASRDALHGLAVGLTEELRGRGVGVTYVEPSRVTEGTYFQNNRDALDRLPTIMRDARFARLWQTEDEIGEMVVRALGRDAAVASPAWIRVATSLSQLTFGALGRLITRL